MTPICPKCGAAVLYITGSSREDKIFIVDAEEKRFITKLGRIAVGHQEHICAPMGDIDQRPDRMAEVTGNGENAPG
jgi:hypothetical protein